MSKTSTQLFRMLTPEGGIIAPGFLQRHVKPVVGERVTVLNFPDILHFTVEAFDDNYNDADGNIVAPSTIVLRRDTSVAPRPVAMRPQLPDDHIAGRLKAMLPDAQLTIPEKLLLRLTPLDFVTLCVSEGISEGDCEIFDALAYEDVPLLVVGGAEGRSEFNGYTRVDGQTGDFGRLYLSAIDGGPFRIDPVVRRLAELYFAELLPRDKATAALFDCIVRLDTSAHGARALDAIAEALTLIDLNMQSPRLAAQDLTDLMHRIGRLEAQA
jgi:hypothetical protein